MLNIKKYANGRFFDTNAKKYIKPEKLAEIIKRGEEIQVTLTKTGKDITDSVIAQFSKKEEKKKDKKKSEIPFIKTEKLMNWLGDVIDSKIEKVMDVVKLPTREQVANLDKHIQELNKKIDALKLSQEKATKKKTTTSKKAAPKKTAPKKASPKKETTTPTGKTQDTKTAADESNTKKATA